MTGGSQSLTKPRLQALLSSAYCRKPMLSSSE